MTFSPREINSSTWATSRRSFYPISRYLKSHPVLSRHSNPVQLGPKGNENGDWPQSRPNIGSKFRRHARTKRATNRDEAWRKKIRAIEKGGRASNPENHHFLGWSSRSVASRGHPYRQIKKIIIDRQSSNWEKGLRKQSSLQKGAQLASSLTQVKLHLLNFRADDPNNWEVAEFLPERVSNRGLLTFGSRFNTIARRKESQTIIFVFKKKQGRCTLRIGTWHRFNSHRAKQFSFLGHKQFLFV